MQVKKRNGSLEPVDLNKIVRAVGLSAAGLANVDPMRVSTRTISGLYDGATTAELDRLSIQTAAALIAEEPEYSFLAARLLAAYIGKEVRQADIQSFGLRTVYDRYLLKDPETRLVIETPQYFFMRVACGLAKDPREAIEFYQLISSLAYMPSSPTLFNSGTMRTQLSSCYLLDSPKDDLADIYARYGDIARLSKYAGGIGLSYSRVRSQGSLIRGTNGNSNGIVPFLKTLDSSVAAVNQGGRRKGAACVYLETWHADIEQFLELRENTGDEMRRTHNLNLANWVPDLFMKRVKAGEDWSLFDPKVVPELVDLYGEEFEKAYVAAEEAGKAVSTMPAQTLYSRMMRSLAQTGDPKNVIHLSNLCTEILEVTSADETAVRILREGPKWGANLRMVRVPDIGSPREQEEARRVWGGTLVQGSDDLSAFDAELTVAGAVAIPAGREDDLRLAQVLAKHLKSNAISLVKDGMLVGAGARHFKH